MLATGCFSVSFQDGTVACGEAGCPGGMTCADDGYCYRAVPDASPDARADPDAMPDARAPEPAAADAARGDCEPAPVEPLCDRLPALPAPPVLDGVPEPCGPSLQPIATTHWRGNASAPPDDHRAEVGVAWRADGIYVFAVVHEPELDPAEGEQAVWNGDAIEIYVDDDGLFFGPPGYDEPGTGQFVAASPEPGGSSTRGALYVDTTEVGAWSSFVAVATDSGYIVEAFAATSALSGRVLMRGQRVGLDLGVNIARDSVAYESADQRMGQYFLSIAAADELPWPYENIAAFCTPVLAAPAP